MNTEDFMIEAGIIPEPAERTKEWKTVCKVTHCLIRSNHLFLGFVVDMNFIHLGEYPKSFASGCWRLMEHDPINLERYAKNTGFTLSQLATTLGSKHFDHVSVDRLIRRLGEAASTTASGELELDL